MAGNTVLAHLIRQATEIRGCKGCRFLKCSRPINLVNETVWESWLERLYSLRRDKRDSYERPHKPVLQLSIIDLLDRGVIRENAVPFSEELVATFKCYFAVVKQRDDKPTIENPFYFLAGDKFWQVTPQGGGLCPSVSGVTGINFWLHPPSPARSIVELNCEIRPRRFFLSQRVEVDRSFRSRTVTILIEQGH